MKNIQAEKYRKGSEILLSDKLSARIVNDDLKSSCIIYFQVLDKLNQQLDQGNLSISGDDYQAWDGSSEQLYQYIAKQLNLEITGDYVELVNE
jgi:hypothetical protein